MVRRRKRNQRIEFKPRIDFEPDPFSGPIRLPDPDVLEATGRSRRGPRVEDFEPKPLLLDKKGRLVRDEEDPAYIPSLLPGVMGGGGQRQGPPVHRESPIPGEHGQPRGVKGFAQRPAYHDRRKLTLPPAEWDTRVAKHQDVFRENWRE